MTTAITSAHHSFNDFSQEFVGVEETTKEKSVDLINTPFFHKSWVIKTAKTTAALACACVISILSLAAAGFIMQSSSSPAATTCGVVVGIGVPLAVCIKAAYYIFNIFMTIYYQDPAVRRSSRLQLENDKISLDDFIEKHTWTNIRVWGLGLQEHQNPLCTEALLTEKLFNTVDDLIYKSCRYYRSRSFSVTRTTRIGNTTYYDTYTYPFYAIATEARVIRDCLDHGISSLAEEKEKLLQPLENKFSRFKSYHLLADWEFIRNCLPDMIYKRDAKQIAWLEKNRDRFNQIQSHYAQHVNAIDGGGKHLVDPLANNPVDPPPSFPRPNPPSNFFLKLGYSYHENEWDTINIWYRKQLDAFEKEYRALS